MKKIWSNWCEKVEKHNIPLNTYALSEEMWSPYDIFYPILEGLIVGIMATLFFIVKRGSIIGFFKVFLFFGLGITIVMYVFSFLNWKAYE